MKENIIEELKKIEGSIAYNKQRIADNKKAIKTLLEKDYDLGTINSELKKYSNDINAYFDYLTIIAGQLRTIKNLSLNAGYKEIFEKAQELIDTIYRNK